MWRDQPNFGVIATLQQPVQVRVVGLGIAEVGWLVYFQVDSLRVGPPLVVEVAPGSVGSLPEVGPGVLG